MNTKIGWGGTEDGARLKAARGYSAKVQIGRRPVQRWKSEAECRVRSTDYRGKVGAGQDRLQSTEYREANKGDWLA